MGLRDVAEWRQVEIELSERRADSVSDVRTSIQCLTEWFGSVANTIKAQTEIEFLPPHLTLADHMRCLVSRDCVQRAADARAAIRPASVGRVHRADRLISRVSPSLVLESTLLY
jgi:hypothetical protein